MIWSTSGLALALAVALPPSKPACQLLTSAEVKMVVGVAVTIDPSQSGPGEGDGDFCAWKTPDGHFVILGVYRKASAAAAHAEYAAQLVSAFGGGPAAKSIAGVGDEAQYRNYTGHLKGGVVVVRAGAVVFTLEGPMEQAAILGLSNVVLARVASQ